MEPTALHRRRARGMTLLEAVISLSVLLVGLVGMLRLQVWAVTSDEGGRSRTQALQVARELLNGLEQLPVDDARLTPHGSGTAPPSGFGHLLAGDAVTTDPFTAFSDSVLPQLPGVTLDSWFLTNGVTDPIDGSPRFQRRWTVWMPSTPLSSDSSKLIAVSVIYRERGLPGLREVVLYGTVINSAAVTAYANLMR